MVQDVPRRPIKIQARLPVPNLASDTDKPGSALYVIRAHAGRVDPNFGSHLGLSNQLCNGATHPSQLASDDGHHSDCCDITRKQSRPQIDIYHIAELKHIPLRIDIS